MKPSLSLSGALILVVDDEPAMRKIADRLLRREEALVLGAGSTREAEELLATEQPHLIVLDIELPGESGLEFLERVGPRYPDTAIIMSTGVDDAAVAARAMRSGAMDYVVKPFSQGGFLSSVRSALDKRRLLLENRRYREQLEQKVVERTRQLEQAQDASVFALAKLAQSRDDETGLHLERMREYSTALTREMQTRGMTGVDDQFVLDVYRSSPLHDIGKVGIPDAILLKRERHTPEEFELMKTHSIIGAQCLDGAAQLMSGIAGSFLAVGRQVALAHHEAWNGDGYPRGLKEEEIPLAARIVTVADFYDALAFPRVYRPTSFPHEEIVEMIGELAGRKFDPAVVDIFLDIQDRFVQIRGGWADQVEPDEILRT